MQYNSLAVCLENNLFPYRVGTPYTVHDRRTLERLEVPCIAGPKSWMDPEYACGVVVPKNRPATPMSCGNALIFLREQNSTFRTNANHTMLSTLVGNAYLAIITPQQTCLHNIHRSRSQKASKEQGGIRS